ncbi:similar to Saccharomyces cerevisiae YOL041C NOP12 Nucleolar protein involved in pre-25S rRNA processing and biogenesis of large 60S ribosomal subunit [Maudiozyma saulgeensis]|uniref:Nucleolar protein 12 n=1 Tax=Maudiozyma saulgeensis TaxID=1789683 RepID=A0A1X7R316_9SACH|nr:similar to Saccharomyces cerevisiae YOL041C NOP12 Nucleolar protein involved in pre-25S rRNA processing and biogenesis of large 60S ribosomal subunit [Kazachstania saulgeensis]
MSSIDNLFGNVDSKNVESNVNDIFNQKSNAVDTVSIKTKLRTILPSIKKKRKNTGEEKEKDQKVNDDQIEEESKADEPVAKKQKKKDGEGEDDLEGKYFAKIMDTDEKDKKNEENDSDSDDKSTKSKHAEKAKKVDLKEDELEKAERTIFVGNVTNEVITSKDKFKLFKKLFSTDPNPKEDDDDEEEADKETKKKKQLYVIESVRFRSISFKEALPRKVAFAQQKLHDSREAVNAYIVYKEKDSVRPLLKKLNATVFENRHLRVDSVIHPAPHDKQRSIFVGNLDFEEDEESLWKHFGNCGEIEYVRIIRDSVTNMGKGFAYVQFYELQSVNKALLLNGKPMISVTATKNKKGRKLRVTRCKNMRKEKNSSETRHSKGKNFNKLNESQRTKMGRAGRVLGKADKATLGKQITIEGLRATKGEKVSHLKRKKQRSKSGRVTKRSIAYKKAQTETSDK